MERRRSSRRYKPLGEKIKDSLRHFVAFMFSNVGIIGLVVGYTIVGALVFQHIEGKNPKAVTKKEEETDRLRNATVNYLWNVTCCWIIPLEEDVWIREANKLIEDWQRDFVKTMKGEGSDSGKSTDNWSFSGAFLYSLTVITTIGYGNVTPRSEWGKITTVLYAIIGMPLFLLYLSNIGDILAKSFKWTYAKLWLCKGCPGARRRRLARAMQHGGMSASRPSVKSLPPVAGDFGDNHSWTPGAHPAVRRGRGRPGVHASSYDGYPCGPARERPAPRGRRARPRHHQDDDDDDEGPCWAASPRSPSRARRVGVVRRGDADHLGDDLGEDDWESSPRSRSQSRSALRKGGAGVGAAAGAGYQRGRTPVSVSPADLHGGWAGAPRAGGPRWSRGRSAEYNEDTDLEMACTAARRVRHPDEAGHRGAPRRRERRPRRRADHEDAEEEEESDSSDDSDVEDAEEEEEEEQEEEEQEEEEEGATLSEEDADEDDAEDEGADADTNSSSESGETYDPQTVTVPVTLCLAIMVGYVCGGAMMFALWEDWDMLNGSYFCFISLSTIGFGDIVPGDSVYSKNSENKIEPSFIFCSMYLMMGMALIAMCFNLMQEEVIHKIRSCIRTIRYVTRCNRRRRAAEAAAAS